MKLSNVVRYQEWGIQFGLETKSRLMMYHREDGPAEIKILDRSHGILRYTGLIQLQWLLYGNTYRRTEHYFSDAGCSEEIIAFYILKYGMFLPDKVHHVNEYSLIPEDHYAEFKRRSRFYEFEDIS